MGFLLGTVAMSAFWLTGWHTGFDVGYGAAMSDALLGVKTPEQFFKSLLGDKNNARRGVSH